MFRKTLTAALLVALADFAGSALAGDFEKDLFLLADFDTPFQINGVAEPQPQVLNEKGFCEGRFGKGYLFQQAGWNMLPANIAATRSLDGFKGATENSLKLIADPDCAGEKMISAEGGMLSIQKIPFNVSYSYVAAKSGLTGTCSIKGPKGVKVVIEVELAPFEGDTKASIEKFSKREDSSKGPLIPDKSCPQTVELTGEWQRIAAYSELDNRLTENRVASMSVKMLSPTPQAQLFFRKFQIEQTYLYPRWSFAPTRWMPGETTVAASSIIDITNIDVLQKFPVKAGTVSMWIRPLADTNLTPVAGIFLMGGPAGAWELNTNGFDSMSKKGCSFKLPQSQKMIHFAATWDEGKTDIYIDGLKTASVERQPKETGDLSKYRLLLGTVGGRFTEAEMDEIAIFNRVLSPEEIGSLKNRKSPLRSIADDFILSAFKRQIYYRDENGAAINFDSYVPYDTNAKISATVNGVAMPVLDLNLEKGKTEISIPFKPYLYGIGSFAVVLQGRDANGKELFNRTESVEIKGQLQRDKFKFMSWGGSNYTPPEYMNLVGINTANVNWDNMREVKKISSLGLYLNLRVENQASFYTTMFDVDRIRKETREKLLPFKGLHNWTMTLSNSEVYSGGRLKEMRDKLTATPDEGRRETARKWFDWATKQLGEAPDPGVTDNGDGISRPKGWVDPADGIIESNGAIRTLAWFMNAGMQQYIPNGVNTELVHELSPGNITWTEPALSSGMFNNLDMGADWGYEFNPYSVLEYFKCSSARARSAGKLYMPTLSMAYWPGVNVKKNGKNVTVAMSVDDLTIKSWIALGGIPAHALSFFAADIWSEGEKNPDLLFIDKGCGEAFGKIARARLHPAAALLRDMPMTQAPVAILLPETTAWTNHQWLGNVFYSKAWKNTLGESLIDYDVLYDRDITVENLKRYRTLLFPMANIVLRKNYDVIKAAAASSTVVVDKLCKQEYPNMKRLDTTYNYPKLDETSKVVLDYLKSLREVLKPSLPVWADGQSGPVLAFGREYGNRFYAVIINNKRTTGNLNQFFTEKWYEPYGAAQKATVSLKIPDGSTVYDFNSSRKISYKYENGRAKLELDMAPAAGHVLCVYPKEFKALEITPAGSFEQGKTASFKIKITDSAKQSPGGRQVLSAKLSDPAGKIRDESDLYVLENGAGEIPVRFMLKDATGKWKLELKELSSGLIQEYGFTVK
jgi:hypothetical protein